MDNVVAQNEVDFETFERIEIAPYYTNSSLQHSNTMVVNSNMYAGNSAEGVIEQQNRIAMQQMGYSPPVVPPTDPSAFQEFMKQQQMSKAEQQHAEIVQIMNETYANNARGNYSSAEEMAYEQAFDELNTMLEGKKELSIADALYSIEAAYGNVYLSKEEYDERIRKSRMFIQAWMQQHGLEQGNEENVHYAIQSFMGESLEIKQAYEELKTRTTKHAPFYYDYIDFKGEKDFRNYFVTKCWATGTGQCNSLPGIYLILAEQLGAEVYLCFAPQHSYIKYKDSKEGMHSYEPTSHWKISDKWYIEHMGISREAVINGIYLDTLNREMIVANCMLDLAHGYMQKFGVGDGSFVEKCIGTAMAYFPHGNNINAYFLISSMLAHRLEALLYEHGIRDLDRIDEVEGARELYDALMKNEVIIKALGYEDMPEEMYMQMMEEYEFKGKQQQGMNSKEKRELFEEIIE
jgi:hypothetical protein